MHEAFDTMWCLAGLYSSWLTPITMVFTSTPLPGAVISTFHVLVERFPWIEGSGGVCDPANPCTIKWVEELGFITIPTMALSAFVLIALLMSHLPSGAAAGAGPTPDQEHDAP